MEAHKIVLAASSPFFRNLKRKNKYAHPLIYMGGMKAPDLKQTFVDHQTLTKQHINHNYYHIMFLHVYTNDFSLKIFYHTQHKLNNNHVFNRFFNDFNRFPEFQDKIGMLSYLKMVMVYG